VCGGIFGTDQPKAAVCAKPECQSTQKKIAHERWALATGKTQSKPETLRENLRKRLATCARPGAFGVELAPEASAPPRPAVDAPGAPQRAARRAHGGSRWAHHGRARALDVGVGAPLGVAVVRRGVGHGDGRRDPLRARLAAAIARLHLHARVRRALAHEGARGARR
jgi:hypothetical protein